jgi:hypothetical protein
MHANDLVPPSSLDQTDSTKYAAKRRIVPPVAFDACYAYRLRNANLTQATKIARALGSVGEPEQADERAARLVGVLQRTGIEVNSTNLEHVARLIDLTRFLKSKEISRPSLQTVRELAVAHAVWRGKQTQTTPAEPVGRAGWFDAPWFSDLFGRVDDGTRFVSPNPLGQNPERSPAQSPTAWSNDLIRDGVTALAQRYGITSTVQIALMIDVLQNPSLTAGQRGVASGRSESGVRNTFALIRQAAGLTPGCDLRPELARLTGMPLAALISRIGTEADPKLGQRVMGHIPEGHRERVAKLLLTVRPGRQTEIDIYQALDDMFTTDPLAADIQRSAGNRDAMNFLRATFARERIPMLREMGFGYEQILSMNPIGRELANRFDPALGTFSAEEVKLRQAKNLPNTREEAALRLMTARTSEDLRLSYRSWVPLALLSDKHWLMPQDLINAYQSVSPTGSLGAASLDSSKAFRVAEALRGRPIARGSSQDLMDRNYRQDINRLLLQTFGLGATGIATGRLESIPTGFEPRDRYASNELPDSSARRRVPESTGTDDVRWQQLLPLLRRPQTQQGQR